MQEKINKIIDAICEGIKSSIFTRSKKLLRVVINDYDKESNGANLLIDFYIGETLFSWVFRVYLDLFKCLQFECWSQDTKYDRYPKAHTLIDSYDINMFNVVNSVLKDVKEMLENDLL